MPDPILITGTDTGVGKTWVACALAGAFRESGERIVAVKPVETGCAGPPGAFEDGVLLARATGQREPAQALVRLSDPIAPAVALHGINAELEFDDIVLRIEACACNADTLLIEGAGGLLSPITWDWNAVDLAHALGARALVVASDRLGTINHTLLTLGALELAGVPVAGVILTMPAVPDPSTGSNAEAIARLSGLERVLVVPRTADPTLAAMALAPVRGWLAGALK